MCFSTLPIAPSFTTTTNIATTNTSSIDHLPKRCTHSRIFFVLAVIVESIKTSLVSNTIFKIGRITLNKKMITNKNTCPCFNKFQQAVNIEKSILNKNKFCKSNNWRNNTNHKQHCRDCKQQ